MKRFIRSLAAVMVAVMIIIGHVPAIDVNAEGRIDGAGMTIAAGGAHSVAVLSDGSLWAWGNNEFGQLGNGTTSDRLSPVRIMDNVLSVSAGLGHTLAIRADGSLWAWGWNEVGQLGDGTTTDRFSPVRILDNVSAVSAGFLHTTAIRTDGSLWVWGNNEAGQLGDGTTVDRLNPVRIMDNVLAISAGLGHTLAIRTDGSLWAWGWNEMGQLGDGTTVDRRSPVRIMDNVSVVSAGFFHSMTIRTDGSLWAWGNNEVGQLGDGTTIDQLSPIRIMENVSAVTAGTANTMAVRSDESLWAWGVFNASFFDYDLANMVIYSSPERIDENVSAISSGEGHTMSLRADGSLWSWGTNGFGQVGDGTRIIRHSPVHVLDNVMLLESAPVQPLPPIEILPPVVPVPPIAPLPPTEPQPPVQPIPPIGIIPDATQRISLNSAAPFFDSGYTLNEVVGGAGFFVRPSVRTERTVRMGGQEFRDVITFNSGGRNNQHSLLRFDHRFTVFSLHNLSGQYQTLTGYVGRVDGTGQYDVDMRIIGDGQLLQTIELNATALPTPISVNVENVRQLRIEVEFPQASQLRQNNRHIQSVYALSAYVQPIVLPPAQPQPPAQPLPPTQPFPPIGTIPDATQRISLNSAAPFFDSGYTLNEVVGGAGFFTRPSVRTERTVRMGGQEFRDVITFNSGGRNNQHSLLRFDHRFTVFSLHNLNGQYRTLTGYVGRVDGTGQYDVDMRIIGDGRLLQTIELNATALPTPISVNVENVRQLRIEVEFPQASQLRQNNRHVQSVYALSAFVQ